MSTLLLRLAAPMQSWGMESKFSRRATERMPTKSGIVGLCACALGRKRTEPLDDLTALCFGARADRQGELLIDFQTAKPSDKISKNPFISHRHYLADAVFLVGLGSEDDGFLHAVAEALRSPQYPLFLGRRSCPPTLPLVLGVRPLPLREALMQEPPLCSATNLPIMLDAQGEGNPRRDLPRSFSQERREYIFRSVEEGSYVYHANQTE
ncbi:MAG: type I-E CRISPR-associated protein Cas5/CasD [Christensenellaceae bacterium]|jgi:CRISPR system Cascade subunit CasD|nr:type I-E CRISPR-associated protein Cas5/CasD [Christensenellaceae bacterium]